MKKTKTKPKPKLNRFTQPKFLVVAYIVVQLVAGSVYGYWIWKTADRALVEAARTQTELWLATHTNDQR
jgi:hypothetical protein